MLGWKSCEGGLMPKAAATIYGVLCDTSYFIRWAKPTHLIASKLLKQSGSLGWGGTLETQLAASRATAANLLSALVAGLTVTTSRLPVNS